MQTAVVRVRDPNPKVGRAPERSSSSIPAVRLSSPMDEGEDEAPTELPSPSGGFLSAQDSLPPTAIGETDSEIPVFTAPPPAEPDPLVRPPRAPPKEEPPPPATSEPAVPIDDLVLDED